MGRPRPIGCQTRRTHQAEECRKRKLQNAGDVGSVDLQAKLQKRDNRIEALETENRGLKEKTERLRIDHEAFVRQTVADKAQFFQMVQAMRQEIDLLKLRENRPDSGNYLSSRYCITSLEQSQLGPSSQMLRGQSQTSQQFPLNQSRAQTFSQVLTEFQPGPSSDMQRGESQTLQQPSWGDSWNQASSSNVFKDVSLSDSDIQDSETTDANFLFKPLADAVPLSSIFTL